MKLKNFTFYLSLVLVLTAGCGEKIESTWKNQELTMDGDGQDWEGFPLQYNEEMKVVYGIANDDKNLNFMIRFNDPDLARMFSIRGFTLWLNNEDNEKRKIGIHYKDEEMKDRFMAWSRERKLNRENRTDPSQLSIEPRGIFTLAKNDSITGISIDEIAGFEAVAAMKDNMYCYEFTVPLSLREGLLFSLDASGKREIKIGLEISGMSEEEKERIKEEMASKRGSSGSGGSGMRGGGMKGGGGKGMRGNGMRGGGPQMPDMDGEEYWITVNLATGVE